MRTPFKLKSGNKISFKDMGSTDAVAKNTDPWEGSPSRTLQDNLYFGKELPEVVVERKKADMSEAIPAARRLVKLNMDVEDMQDVDEGRDKNYKKTKGELRKLMDRYNDLMKTRASSAPQSKLYKSTNSSIKEIQTSINELRKQ